MPTNESIRRISEQLTNYSEVDIIYYTLNDDKNNGQRNMTYNVVCDLENVIGNEKLLKNYIAAKEIIKTLYSRANINITFNLISTKEFEEKINEEDQTYMNDLTNACIVYSDSEFLTSLVKGRAK